MITANCYKCRSDQGDTESHPVLENLNSRWKKNKSKWLHAYITRVKRKERQKRFKVGLGYLKQAGLDLRVESSLGVLTFKPGSVFEDKAEEGLPDPFIVKRRDGIEFSLSKELRERYQISTDVDLQRLVRACAILITDFAGPSTKDHRKYLFEQLRTYMRERSNRTGWEIMQALKTLDDFLGEKNRKDNSEYYNLAWILNVRYHLWKERGEFEDTTVDNLDLD